MRYNMSAQDNAIPEHAMYAHGSHNATQVSRAAVASTPFITRNPPKDGRKVGGVCLSGAHVRVGVSMGDLIERVGR